MHTVRRRARLLRSEDALSSIGRFALRAPSVRGTRGAGSTGPESKVDLLDVGLQRRRT
ncbi:Hypothetical protein A7982_04584 [Minicystis rosea]|nr:Hypothetical protein A7982_04584 [Minicystis rosea]